MKNKEDITEKIKALIRELIARGYRPNINMSVYIAEQLEFNYTYLSNIFSEIHHITIEHFYIDCKIEKAKELLEETDNPIHEIATLLHYCSKAHFSTQFKLVAGVTPSIYRQKKKGWYDHDFAFLFLKSMIV